MCTGRRPARRGPRLVLVFVRIYAFMECVGESTSSFSQRSWLRASMRNFEDRLTALTTKIAIPSWIVNSEKRLCLPLAMNRLVTDYTALYMNFTETISP